MRIATTVALVLNGRIGDLYTWDAPDMSAKFTSEVPSAPTFRLYY